jgi:LCP family protein required for cell wall assembly
MADDKRPDGPEYGWLYSGKDGSPPPPPPSGDPEATQQIDRPSDDEPEHTQVLGVGGGPDQRSETPPPAAEKPTSFGGTYDAPPPRQADDGPRFATPADSSAPPPTRPAPKPAAPPKKPRRPGSRRKWWIRGILALLLAWLLFLILVPIWAWSKIDKVDAEPSGTRPEDTPGTTYLLVGSDSREGLSTEQKSDLGTGSAQGQRTDTILLLHIPDGDGPNLLLSIPRDSWVTIPGHGENKINAAYAIGGAKDGPKLLVQTIEANTKIHIDDYIEIGFTGFVDVVDAVGGIEVCPKQAINDPKAGHLKMQPGCQEVDGHKALDYSRSRAFANGDITRTEHQREVITQVGKKAASWQTIVLPWRYFKVNKAGADSLRIGDNVGPIDLMKFAWAMAHSGSQKRCVVPFSSLNFTTPDGQSAVQWDEQRSTALFTKIREDDTAGAQCNATGQS